MEIELTSASMLAVGDVIGLDDTLGWQLVEAVAAAADGPITVTVRALLDDERRVRVLAPADTVRRAEPGALHETSEFLGMSAARAEVWAGALGWSFRNISDATFVTDDWRRDRINVWTDAAGVVVRAELY